MSFSRIVFRSSAVKYVLPEHAPQLEMRDRIFLADANLLVQVRRNLIGKPTNRQHEVSPEIGSRRASSKNACPPSSHPAQFTPPQRRRITAIYTETYTIRAAGGRFLS
jgi:hypothetical protein